MNNTSLDGDYEEGFIPMDSNFVIITKEVMCVIVTIVALVGNSLVIASVLQHKRMRTGTNYLIMNMAIVDILYILVTMPELFLAVSYYYWASDTLFFKVCCKGLNFSQFMLQAASVLTLAFIAADRYFAIMMPLKRIYTQNAFYISLVVIWIVSAGVAAPVLYSFRVYKYPDGYVICAEDWEPAFDTAQGMKWYTIILFIVVYCVPFFAMTIVYSIICKKLWTRKAIGEGNLNDSGKKILQSRKKVVKMLVTVVVVFVICWLPVQLASLWGYFTDEVHFIPPWIHFTCKFVMRAHPALNPCIYAIFSQNFRDGFKLALKCYCCRSHSTKAEFLTSKRLGTVRMSTKAYGKGGEGLLGKRAKNGYDDRGEIDTEQTRETVL